MVIGGENSEVLPNSSVAVALSVFPTILHGMFSHRVRILNTVIRPALQLSPIEIKKKPTRRNTFRYSTTSAYA